MIVKRLIDILVNKKLSAFILEDKQNEENIFYRIGKYYYKISHLEYEEIKKTFRLAETMQLCLFFGGCALGYVLFKETAFRIFFSVIIIFLGMIPILYVLNKLNKRISHKYEATRKTKEQILSNQEKIK